MTIPCEAISGDACGGQPSKKAERIAALTLVICRLHELGQHISYDVLIGETGIPRASLVDLLTTMRREGLVTWDEGFHGSLRPTVQEVARTL